MFSSNCVLDGALPVPHMDSVEENHKKYIMTNVLFFAEIGLMYKYVPFLLLIYSHLCVKVGH